MSIAQFYFNAACEHENDAFRFIEDFDDLMWAAQICLSLALFYERKNM